MYKKVLFFDDSEDRIKELQLKCSRYDFVIFDKNLGSYIDFDGSRAAFFKEDLGKLDFLFIHDGFKDSSLPGNYISLINENLDKTYLFKFSGGKETDLENRELNREELYRNFTQFLQIFQDFGIYVSQALTDGTCYKAIGNKLLFHLRRKMKEVDDWYDSNEFEGLVKLLGVSKDKYRMLSSKEAAEAFKLEVENL